MTYQVARYGWKPDLPDHRDIIFKAATTALPKVWDLAPQMPAIYDQAQLGSCTGNGWARVMQYMGIRQGEHTGVPSRLFIYYYERKYEGTLDHDSGAYVRDGARVCATLGVPPETLWPYIPSFYLMEPPQAAQDAAVKFEALQYQRIVQGPGAPMRAALAGGYPIVFGFAVPDTFENGWDFTTPLPLPTPANRIVGGHCVVVTGYDWSCTRFKVPAFQCDNSWGPDWGLNGRFWMDARWFDTKRGLAQDLWIVKQVS